MARAIKRSRYNATRSTEEHVSRRCLVDLPFDVLIEIFLFLEPAELLYLSRTTKWMRAFLLNREKASVFWKNAIDNVGLPPCPDWMSPPTYAFLAFDPVCHMCYRACETVEWELRMRCCSKCLPKMTTEKYCSDIDNLVLPVAKSRNDLNDGGAYIDVHVVDAHPTPLYSRSDWELVRTAEWLEGLSSENFVAQQNKFWRSVRQHANVCRAWERGRLEEKAHHLLQARIERVEDIKSKLIEMGCLKTVVAFCDHADFWLLPQVMKFERLTQEEWPKIHPQLVHWLEEALCDDRRHALEFAILELDTGEDTSLLVKPRHVDVAVIPAIRSLLEPHLISKKTNWDLITKLRRVLRREIKHWSDRALEELEQMAREALGLPPRSNPSTLLPVIFRCTGKTCCQRLRFDEALSHGHLYKAKPERPTSGISRRRISPYNGLLRGYSTHPRNTQVLRVDVTASRRIENLVIQLGQNPSWVTYDEMTQSAIKVVCNLCHPKVATDMDFESAFKHCLDSHPRKKETNIWTVSMGE